MTYMKHLELMTVWFRRGQTGSSDRPHVF